MPVEKDKQKYIEELAHLYVDGAFDRRELLKRVTRVVGSAAAAAVALEALELPADARDHEHKHESEFECECPTDVRVPEDAHDILVIHENRGLNDHIRDVTRRAARGGFVAVGIDLLSRFGGTPDDPEQALALYQQTTSEGRLADMLSAIDYLQGLDIVQQDKLAAVGFCAGGGNCWNLALNTDALSAAVAFYGTPAPPVAMLEKLTAPALAIYAELDRNLTMSILPVINRLEQLQKPFGFHIYKGVNHAFHNDTGTNYNRAAACDAWTKTLAFFGEQLK